MASDAQPSYVATIAWAGGAKTLELSNGASFAAPVSVRLSPIGDGLEILMELTVDAGVPCLSYFSCVGGNDVHINPAAIHNLPMTKLFELAVKTVGFVAEANPAQFGLGSEEGFNSVLRHPSQSIKGGDDAVGALRIRRTLTDGLLREVADIVQSDTTGAPREAIRDRMHVSLRTTSRWIAEARKRGFLPPKGQS